MSSTNKPIDFNRPPLVGGELDNIRRAVEEMHTSGDGPFTRRCAELLQAELGVPRIMLTTSCTAALEMCALLLDVRPGDEVIVPSFSFVTTASAFALRGARTVFADVRPDTLNLDESRLEPLITKRTRAIVLVNYAGVGCEMDAILPLAASRGIPVVEDNAHGVFAKYRGRHLGTFGELATLSFHETKNISCGEGGALLINAEKYGARAEIIRDKGTDRQKLFRGEVDKYTWVDLGSSFVLSDVLAAYLFAQLEARERVLARRREIWERYDGSFRGSLEVHGVQLPTVPPHCEQSYHMYHMLLPEPDARQALIEHLKSRDIHSQFHFMPLHLSKVGRRIGGSDADCPVTEDAAARLLRLPFFYDLSEPDQQRVIDEVQGFFKIRS